MPKSKNGKPQRFYLQAPENDPDALWEEFIRVPTDFSTPFELTGRRSIFSFVGDIGQMTSGPLIFNFSLSMGEEKAVKESQEFYSCLIEKYDVDFRDITVIKNGHQGILLIIEQGVFRKELPGTYLPTIYGFMLHEFFKKKHDTLDYDLYINGIYSTITFDKKQLSNITYRNNRKIFSINLPKKRNYLASIFEKCLKSHFKSNVNDIKIEKFLPNNQHLLSHKVFFTCSALKNAINSNTPTKNEYDLFIQTYRCLGEDGKQAAYMHNELLPPRYYYWQAQTQVATGKNEQNKPYHYFRESNYEWFDSCTKNVAPPSCIKLREQGLCTRDNACGVLHPAELAYETPKKSQNKSISPESHISPAHLRYCQESKILSATTQFFNIRLAVKLLLTALLCQGRYFLKNGEATISLTFYIHIAGSENIPELQAILQEYANTIAEMESCLTTRHKHAYSQQIEQLELLRKRAKTLRAKAKKKTEPAKQEYEAVSTELRQLVSKAPPEPQLTADNILPSSPLKLSPLAVRPIYFSDLCGSEPTAFSRALLSRSKKQAPFVTTLTKAYSRTTMPFLTGCLNQSSYSDFGRLFRYGPLHKRGLLNKFLLFDASRLNALPAAEQTLHSLPSEQLAEFCWQSVHGSERLLQLDVNAQSFVREQIKHLFLETKTSCYLHVLKHLRPTFEMQILKVAALLHITKHLNDEIPEMIPRVAVEAATCFVLESLADTITIYRRAGVDRHANCSQAIVTWLHNRGQPHVYARDIHRSFDQTYTPEMVRAAIKQLCAAGTIVSVQPQYRRPRGKPSKNLFLVSRFREQFF